MDRRRSDDGWGDSQKVFTNRCPILNVSSGNVSWWRKARWLQNLEALAAQHTYCSSLELQLIQRQSVGGGGGVRAQRSTYCLYVYLREHCSFVKFSRKVIWFWTKCKYQFLFHTHRRSHRGRRYVLIDNFDDEWTSNKVLFWYSSTFKSYKILYQFRFITHKALLLSSLPTHCPHPPICPNK